MKISQNFYTIVKRFFKTSSKKMLDSNIRIKTLVKDTFTKKEKQANKFVRHSCDSFVEHVPEFILRDGDTTGITIRKMKFYQGDVEKMSTMNLDEMMEYKAKLINAGKYTYE